MLATRMRMSSGGGGLKIDVPVGATLFSSTGSVLVALATDAPGFTCPDTGLLVFRTAGNYGTVNMPEGLEVSYLVVAAGGRGGNGGRRDEGAGSGVWHGGLSGGGLQTAGFTGTHTLTASMAFTVGAANGENSTFKGTVYAGGLTGGNSPNTANGADMPAGSTQSFLGYTYGGRLGRRSSHGPGAAATVWGQGGQPGLGAALHPQVNYLGGNGKQGIILLHWGGFSKNYNPVTNTCS